jgi:hypothetical protein
LEGLTVSAKPDDLADFYNADIGVGVTLALTTAAAQTTDAMGPLPPGRYLVQVVPAAPGVIVWMAQRRFVKARTEVLTAAAPAFPFAQIFAMEVSVRKGFSDRFVALTSSSTAAMYISQISRAPKKAGT